MRTVQGNANLITPQAYSSHMTYRGVYRDGVIVPESSLSLPDGAHVDFDYVRSRAKQSDSKAKVTRVMSSPAQGSKKPRRATAKDRVGAFMQGFGIMRREPTWKGKSSAAIARTLRKRAMGERFRG